MRPLKQSYGNGPHRRVDRRGGGSPAETDPASTRSAEIPHPAGGRASRQVMPPTSDERIDASRKPPTRGHKQDSPDDRGPTVCGCERVSDGDVTARRRARGIDPPDGTADIVEAQAVLVETISVDVLPGDSLFLPVPVSRDPAGARAAERAVAVVYEQSRVLSFHQSKRYARSPRGDADLSYAEVGVTRGRRSQSVTASTGQADLETQQRPRSVAQRAWLHGSQPVRRGRGTRRDASGPPRCCGACCVGSCPQAPSAQVSTSYLNLVGGWGYA